MTGPSTRLTWHSSYDICLVCSSHLLLDGCRSERRGGGGRQVQTGMDWGGEGCGSRYPALLPLVLSALTARMSRQHLYLSVPHIDHPSSLTLMAYQPAAPPPTHCPPAELVGVLVAQSQGPPRGAGHCIRAPPILDLPFHGQAVGP